MKKTNKKQNGGINNPNGLANFEEDFLLPPSTTNLDDVSDEENKFLLGGRFSKESREERKEGRKSRRADRKKTRSAVKAYKKSERNKRRDKVNDAGEDISMSRADKRENRRTVRATSRAFKKEERGERRDSKKSLLAKQKADRIAKKTKTKSDRNAKVKTNVAALNKAVGDTVKSEKKSTIKKSETTTKKSTTKKEETFGQAFRKNRNAGKKEFTYKGKKYHTRTKEDEAKNKKKTTPTKSTEVKKKTTKKMGPHPKHDQDGNGVPDSIQKRTGEGTVLRPPAKKKTTKKKKKVSSSINGSRKSNSGNKKLDRMVRSSIGPKY